MTCCKTFLKSLHFLILLVYLAFAIITSTSNASAQSLFKTGTFVSTKASSTNMRQGPGFEFDVIIKYKKKGIPLKIRGKFDDWYKLEDIDSNLGWMHISVISTKPFSISVAKLQPMFAKARVDSNIVVFLPKDILVEIIDCYKQFCLVKSDKYQGWVFKELLWGKTNNG